MDFNRLKLRLPQRMDTIYNFRKILLIVKVSKFENEALE